MSLKLLILAFVLSIVFSIECLNREEEIDTKTIEFYKNHGYDKSIDVQKNESKIKFN